MIDIQSLRKVDAPKLIILGNHKGIIQSILDFDYLCGKKAPSISLIVGGPGVSVKYFWGKETIRLKTVPNVDSLENLDITADYFISTDSGRRVLGNTQKLTAFVKGLIAGVVFAESVPERHSLELRNLSKSTGILIIGPSSVGMLIPGILKLGAIGGTQPSQQYDSQTFSGGSLAVISTSGGMTNEIISFAARQGLHLSFAAAVGGERYPVTTPAHLVEAALDDPQTESIVFFGELGGSDEYEIGDIVKNHKNSKKKTLLAYIAGKSAESFETPPQFGHAKALAGLASESATSKINYMNNSGFTAVDTYGKFEEGIRSMSKNNKYTNSVSDRNIVRELENRQSGLFTSSVSKDSGGDVSILGENLVSYVKKRSLTEIALSMFLGHQPKSSELVSFFDTAVRLLVDHGPQVSGAVNTMITARAGKDLPSALASGLLTIGSRFGGAINGSAIEWLGAVENGIEPDLFVEHFAKDKKYIPGIGHKKYRLDNPDPRVKYMLQEFGTSVGTATKFALAVEAITSTKKAALILNVDGLIAALMVDILHDSEGYSYEDVRRLIETEFFNAIFVYARTTGLIAHYLDQKRLDEDLFRLPDNQIDFEL